MKKRSSFAEKEHATDGPAQKTSLCPLWTRKQVAKTLQLCVHSVARYTRRGELPCVKINPRVVRYKQQDVQAFIESGSVK